MEALESCRRGWGSWACSAWSRAVSGAPNSPFQFLRGGYRGHGAWALHGGEGERTRDGRHNWAKEVETGCQEKHFPHEDGDATAQVTQGGCADRRFVTPNWESPGQSLQVTLPWAGGGTRGFLRSFLALNIILFYLHVTLDAIPRSSIYLSILALCRVSELGLTIPIKGTH